MKKGLTVLSGLTAVGTAIGSGILYLKKKDICPKCEIKKALEKTKIHYTKDEMYNNGAALTPPMGWSSWNTFRQRIDENVILEIADAMKCDEIFSLLMGDKVDPRREFIEKNAKFVKNLDI